jgi:cytochrome c55X
MRAHHGLAALTLAVALVAASPAGAEDAAQKSAALSPGGRDDAALVQEGKTIYAHRCSHCHGFNMASAGTVTYDLRHFPADGKERFLDSVVNGKNNRMPPWGDVLSLDEIEAVWAYVMTRGK